MKYKHLYSTEKQTNIEKKFTQTIIRQYKINVYSNKNKDLKHKTTKDILQKPCHIHKLLSRRITQIIF